MAWSPEARLKALESRRRHRRMHPELYDKAKKAIQPSSVKKPRKSQAAVNLPGSGTKEDPYVTNNTRTTISLLQRGFHVKLTSERRATIALDKMAKMVSDARAAGKETKYFDLCKVHVPGTNLFCEDSKGIDRAKMPQLSGKPRPGSDADKLPRDAWGQVDGGKAFMAYLEKKGYKVKNEKRKPEELKASQRELNGGKVAGLTKAMEEGKYDFENPIWVSSDSYVIDGHHRWAGQVWYDLTNKKGEDPLMNTRAVDVDVMTLLDEAHAFAADFGLESASAKAPGVSVPDVGSSAATKTKSPSKASVSGAKVISTPQEAKTFLTEKYQPWRESLTPPQEAALTMYQSPGYSLMNGILRGSPPSAPPKDVARAKAAIKDLGKAIDKAPPLDEPLTVWRSFSATQFSLKTGQTVSDPGFTSVSLTKAQAVSANVQGKQVLAQIKLPAGTKAAGGSVKELILRPDSKFKVVTSLGGKVTLELIP